MEATGYSRDWIQQLARRYNADGPKALGDRRRRNLGARERALLDPDQRRELAEALRKPHEDGGMWNSRKVAEWIEKKTGKAKSKQRGWGTARRFQGHITPRPTNVSKKRLSKKAPDEGGET